MATYLVLSRWTDKGRREAVSLPERAAEVSQHFEEMGGKIRFYLTMGQYDQVAIAEAPNEATIAQFVLYLADRDYVTSETLRCFSMDEMRSLV